MNDSQPVAVHSSKLCCEANAKIIADHIARYGVVVIPSFYNRETVNLLNDEFDSILASPSQKGLRPLEFDHGRGAVATISRLSKRRWPVMHEVFSDPLQRDVARAYWNQKIALNREVYVMNEVPGTTHVAQDLHFDVQETFKSFIYLNDISATNGAFYCIPGSHEETRDIRRRMGHSVSYDNRDSTRAIERTEEAIPIEGPAGTLIFFTTEVLHMAGKVAEGERRIMRGHTRNQRRKLIFF